MPILKTQLFGGSVVGVHLIATNSFVLYPPIMLEATLKKFRPIFEEPFYPITINNSRILGIYIASNKNGMIVPSIIRDDELEKLKSYFGNSINIGILKSIDNAFGNLILCNDKGAIISSYLKDFKKEIEDILNVETVVYEFADYYLPGSCALTNNKGCVVHPLSTDEEIEQITSILKVKETDVSTVNRGSPYLSAGAIVNDKSGIFGVDCTGPEMMRLSNVLEI